MAQPQISSYWTEVISIIENGLKPDPKRVGSFAEHIADRLEKDGEPRLAQRIRAIVERSKMPAGSAFVAQSIAGGTNTSSFFDIESQDTLEPILDSQAQKELDRFVSLHQQVSALESRGIEPPTALLLYGPSGCGKTMAASTVAHKLDRSLLTVRLDGLLTSYLGDSAKNLRRIFDESRAMPSILFLDEFDAVAKMRDDPQELGEIKRLVNSLLQNLDSIKGKQIIIAATNHHHLLDSAIWRRFDVAVEITKPGTSQIQGIIKQNLAGNELDPEFISGLSTLALGLSGAEIGTAVKRTLQDIFLAPECDLNVLLTSEIIRARGIRMVDTGEGINKKALIMSISDLATLPNRQVALLAGCSLVYVHRVQKDTGE